MKREKVYLKKEKNRGLRKNLFFEAPISLNIEGN